LEENAIEEVITELKPRMLKTMNITETLWSHLRRRKVVIHEDREKIEASFTQ
jgi:hypothetical protein